MKALVTGGAGYIGSHLAPRLAELGHEVVVLDNLTAPHADALRALEKAGVRLVRGDVLDPAQARAAAEGCDAVFHLAANPDVRSTTAAPAEAFRLNVEATQRLLEVLRETRPASVVFASTSTVYGETRVVPTPESLGPLEPISTYGATKLAGEALLSAHAHATGQRSTVVRLANVTGPRASHGVVYDLVAKLRRDPRRLEVLGDGRQRKSYVHVDDTVEGILAAWQGQRAPWDAYNIGSADAIDVREVADIVCAALGLHGVQYEFKPGQGGRGWPGDVRVMQLDIAKLRGLGWAPRSTSAQAMRAAAEDLARNAPSHG